MSPPPFPRLLPPRSLSFSTLSAVLLSLSALVLSLSAHAAPLLHVGGSFTSPASSVARWTPATATWSGLGTGVAGVVLALAAYDGGLHVGGGFSSTGGVPATGIARWDDAEGAEGAAAAAWTDLDGGVGGESPLVYALAVAAVAVAEAAAATNGTGREVLVVGGSFMFVGSGARRMPANFIASWDGQAQAWATLGAGMDDSVFALYVGPTPDVYAGGAFRTPGAAVARWDGVAWAPVGAGLDGIVYALAGYGGDLYAGGDMAAERRLARWDGAVWQTVGTGALGRYVLALAVWAGQLFVAGELVAAGGFATNVAGWNGTDWTTPLAPLDDTVYALAVHEDALHAGGAFGGCVARWNGSAWGTVGEGTSLLVRVVGSF